MFLHVFLSFPTISYMFLHVPIFSYLLLHFPIFSYSFLHFPTCFLNVPTFVKPFHTCFMYVPTCFPTFQFPPTIFKHFPTFVVIRFSYIFLFISAIFIHFHIVSNMFINVPNVLPWSITCIFGWSTESQYPIAVEVHSSQCGIHEIILESFHELLRLIR